MYTLGYAPSESGKQVNCRYKMVQPILHTHTHSNTQVLYPGLPQMCDILRDALEMH